jgi:hypothetical protein
MPRGVPGPVIGVRKVKKRPGAIGRPATKGSFVKGHKRGGRPKGVRNKFTEDLKQVILDGLHNTNDEGLFGFVRDTAIETPTAGLSILGRLIPVSLVGTLDGTIVVVHRDETVAEEPKDPQHTQGNSDPAA